jgi:hypothetical protein
MNEVLGDGFTMQSGRLRRADKIELQRLLIAREDVTGAFEACGLLLNTVADDIGHPLYYPLSCAIIVCYARPFTHNQPYGGLGRRWPGYTNPEFRAVHDEVLETRNKIVAHSDAAVRKIRITVPGGRLAKTELYTGLGAMVDTYYLSIEHYRVLHHAARDLGRRLHGEIESRLGHLYDGIELPKRSFPLRIDDGL